MSVTTIPGPGRWRAVLAAVLALQLVVAGCSGVRLRSSPPLIQGIVPEEEIKALAQLNDQRLRDEFSAEWELRGRSAPPRHCLALSGGGVRSAAFSIGVLKALQNEGLLRHFDVMSAVSGGAYALSWYYANHLHHDQNDDGWLTGKSAEATEAREVGPVARLDDKGFVSFFEYLALLGVNTLAAPWNLFANGLFGWHLNTTPARPVYEQKIRETFHDGREVEFGHLRELIKARRLPTFVINTTAYVDDDRNHLGWRLGSTVFEFTPLRYGSGAFGYNNASVPFRVARAVAISGAAVDSVVIAGSTQKTLLSLLNQDLNYTIPNFPENLQPQSAHVRGQQREPWSPAVHNALPFPFYFFSGRYQWDAEGIRIHLADGGHAENLGAFSLVRRLCRTIVIVDAEHDPEYAFNSYFKLKDALRAEFGVDLSVPILDDIRVETVGGVPVERQTPAPAAARDGLPLRTLTVDRQLPAGRRGMQYSVGSIRSFPMPDAPHGRPIWVAYIKLALTDSDLENDSEQKPPYPATVTDYWRRSRKGFTSTPEAPNKCLETDVLLASCVFPQESTLRQNFDGAQFKAYRDLGETIVLRHRDDICRLLRLTP